MVGIEPVTYLEYQPNALPTEVRSQVGLSMRYFGTESSSFDINYFFCVSAGIPKVVGLIPTVTRHIFQACPVWIHTQSNITNIFT